MTSHLTLAFLLKSHHQGRTACFLINLNQPLVSPSHSSLCFFGLGSGPGKSPHEKAKATLTPRFYGSQQCWSPRGISAPCPSLWQVLFAAVCHPRPRSGDKKGKSIIWTCFHPSGKMPMPTAAGIAWLKTQGPVHPEFTPYSSSSAKGIPAQFLAHCQLPILLSPRI